MIDIKDLLTSGKCTDENVIFNYHYNLKAFSQTMDVSKDGNFLFIGLRSNGINIFDIRKRDNIVLFENLTLNGLAISLRLNQKEDLIFFSDSFKFIIF